MAIGDWSAGRIRGLWIVGAIAELLVIYFVFVAPTMAEDNAARRWADSVASHAGPYDDLRRQKFYRLLQDSFGISVQVSGDTLTTFSKDSFSVAAVTHGDTLRRLNLSPAAERSVSAVMAHRERPGRHGAHAVSHARAVSGGDAAPHSAGAHRRHAGLVARAAGDGVRRHRSVG
jgi:hypothetical protein